MKDISLKQKLWRGGAILLATAVCLTGLVGCSPEKKPSGKGGKPGSSQTDPGKNSSLNTGGKSSDSKNGTGKIDSGKTSTGKKDSGKIDSGKTNTGKNSTGKPKPPAAGKPGGQNGN